jgi:hypothetical protein
MIRAILEPLGLFLIPVAAFAIYLLVRLRYPLAIEHWTRGRVSTMTLIGLVIAVVGLFVFGLSAPRGHGAYVPAHVENGQLVPGRIQ